MIASLEATVIVILYVLLDSIEWIVGTYKLNVLTWQGRSSKFRVGSRVRQTTIVGYLMQNSVFTPIEYVICKHILPIHTVEWSDSSIGYNSVYYKSFVCAQFKCQTFRVSP